MNNDPGHPLVPWTLTLVGVLVGVAGAVSPLLFDTALPALGCSLGSIFLASLLWHGADLAKPTPRTNGGGEGEDSDPEYDSFAWRHGDRGTDEGAGR